MKNKILLLLFVSFFSFLSLASDQNAQVPGTFGVGAILGGPTAITGKTFLDSKTAVDFGLSFFDNSYTLLYADYLMHFPGFAHTKGFEQLIGYFGVGGILAITNNTNTSNNGFIGTNQGAVGAGVRVPFGVAWNMPKTPVEFFGEIAPGISIIPSTSILIELGIGARYYFR